MDSKEREAPLKTEQMAIDIGARDKDEALKYVRPGDMAVPDAPFVEFGGGRIAARALDNRVGCALLCRLIAESEHSFTAVFTVQEETGLNGCAERPRHSHRPHFRDHHRRRPARCGAPQAGLPPWSGTGALLCR